MLSQPLGIYIHILWRMQCSDKCHLNNDPVGLSTLIQSTSDRLNKELPLKMDKEKFKRKLCFVHGKDRRFSPRIIRKNDFSHWTITNGLKILFLLFNI